MKGCWSGRWTRIVADEVQDLDQCLVNILIFLASDQCRVVMFIGDKNQDIYGFRNSTYVFAEMQVGLQARTLDLVETFRCGPHVMTMCNVLLRCYNEVLRCEVACLNRRVNR